MINSVAIPSTVDSSFDNLINLLANDIILDMDIIPIIGDDLLWVKTEQGELRLYEKLAIDLAKKHSINLSNNPDRDDDFNFVCHLIKKKNNSSIYHEIRDLLDYYNDSDLVVKEIFEKLVSIRKFKYFINATFTNFLEQSLKKCRHHNDISVSSYSCNRSSRIEDLIVSHNELQIPKTCIYNLYGSYSNHRQYVVDDDDILDLTLSLLNKFSINSKEVLNLRYILENHSLLFLGSNYSNWLFRFFYRTLSPKEFTLDKVVADSLLQTDSKRVFFLEKLGTRYAQGDGRKFITKLYDRIKELNPRMIHDSKIDGHIFISYASENGNEGINIFNQLENKWLYNWYDQRELYFGDNLDQKIENAIRNCSAFIPIITPQTQASANRYFHKEWNFAIELDKPLLPIFIQTDPSALSVHPKFRTVKWLHSSTSLPNIPDSFLRDLEKIQDNYFNLKYKT